MTADQVENALCAVEFREKVILHLAVFSGLRPGEILAFRRSSVAPDGSSVEIDERVYRGDIDSPKNCINPLQSDGYGAGDGGRTRDVQLGKLAFYH